MDILEGKRPSCLFVGQARSKKRGGVMRLPTTDFTGLGGCSM